ncbi:MAG TPA: VOC family protein [Bacteroidia bacterium]|jgi:catechol 2,3-dioxygenase-like lactoylglutathione lyase family enzyme|nr:VOC family protein [Bacteroidia bacterium]
MVTGVQQVGIGVSDLTTSWKWYRKWFGFDVPIFDDVAEAKLMIKYTGDEVHSRRAVLALNMQGGGGFEIWQYMSRKPQAAAFPILAGDIGINAVKIKSPDVSRSYQIMKSEGHVAISELVHSPDNSPAFYVKDETGNTFQFVESNESWFNLRSGHSGGSCGVIIGVTDMNKALDFYQTILGTSKIIYDQKGSWDGMLGLDTKQCTYRRVLLRKKYIPQGAFSELLGHIDIELVQCTGREVNKIYSNRYWGDLGFIHLCLDVFDMDALKTKLASKGYDFTIDSANSFDMGEAAGRFTYAEDPDGTLIEFVETHRVPVMKKLNLYFNLKNRKEDRPLPKWMVKCLALSRVKD